MPRCTSPFRIQQHTKLAVFLKDAFTSQYLCYSVKKFGYFVFGGALIGAFLGRIWSASNNPLAGLGTGTLIGTFIGWFVAAAVFQQNNKEK